jgi:hypothetical protein
MGAVEDSVRFSEDPSASWTYGILREKALSHPTLLYRGNSVLVVLPNDEVERWAESGEVGIYFSMDLGSQGVLEVILEKDFACLDRTIEDNEDKFPNPNIECL